MLYLFCNPVLVFLRIYGFLGLNHAIDTNDDERNRQNLAHVDGERGLEGFLDLLGVLYEEAEGEDIRQAEAEIPAGADFLRHLLMERPHDKKE